MSSLFPILELLTVPLSMNAMMQLSSAYFPLSVSANMMCDTWHPSTYLSTYNTLDTVLVSMVPLGDTLLMYTLDELPTSTANASVPSVSLCAIDLIEESRLS